MPAFNFPAPPPLPALPAAFGKSVTSLADLTKGLDDMSSMLEKAKERNADAVHIRRLEAGLAVAAKEYDQRLSGE